MLEPANYNKYFGPRVSIAQQIENKKTMGIDNVELIHDPTMDTTEKISFPDDKSPIKIRRGK